MRSTYYLAAPVMLLLAILQTAVLARFPLFGLIPQAPLLVALAWGLLRGANEGVVWAFIGGICLDIFSIGPFGFTALSYVLAVSLAIMLQSAVPTSRFFIPILMAALATIVYLLLQLILLRLFGYQTGLGETAVLPPLTLLHSVLIIPIYWLLYLIVRSMWPRQVEI